MIIKVQVPPVGESITEGVLAEWSVADSAIVQKEGPLFILETDKVTMTVNAEHTGKVKILVAAGQTVEIGQVVAELDTNATALPIAEPVAQTSGPAIDAPAGIPQARAKLTQSDLGEFAPAVRVLLQQHDLDPSKIKGSGRDGRITKEDVLTFVKTAPSTVNPPAVSVSVATPTQLSSPATEPLPAPPQVAASRQTRTKMTRLRQRIAERLVQSKNEAALLTTFNEADMTQVLELRARYREAFKKKHSVDLGFMSFFVKAVVDALRVVPEINAQIQGDELVQNHFFDIGVAVGTDHGLVVPVIRDCDSLSFAELEKAIAAMAKKVQEKTISLPELSGGVFTVSNGGIYGSLLSTPIVNPPQSGILGMHAIKKRPIAIDDEVVIRPMMYLALSYDHRLVDGREAVTFLKRVVACIENPERMMLEI